MTWTLEDNFLKAYSIMATKWGLSSDPDDPKHFYDYRALYEETGKLEPDATGHFPSKFKLEGHPNMIVDNINTKTGKSVGGTPRGKVVQGIEEPDYKFTDDPTWGTVLSQKLKSGLGILQTNLLQLGKLVAEGKNETEKLIDKVFFPAMKTKLEVFKEKYGVNPDEDWALEQIKGLVDASQKMQQAASAAGEAKDPLKSFIGKGVEAAPPVIGAFVMGQAMEPISALGVAKMGGAKVAAYWNDIRKMIPFGLTAAASTAKELEQTTPDMPYVTKILASALTGAAEMATERPVYSGVMSLLSKPGKILVEKGAKQIAKSPTLVKWLVNGLLQVAQEVEMEPISMSILQAVGIPQDWKTLPERAKQAAIGGAAMVTVLAGFGGMSAKAQQLVANNIIENKPSVSEAIKTIKAVSKELPRKAEPLAPIVPEGTGDYGMPEAITTTGKDIDDYDTSSQPLENILDLIDTGQEFDYDIYEEKPKVTKEELKVEPKKPWEMTKEEFVKEYEKISDIVDKEELNKDKKMTPKEIEYWKENGWEAFSKKQGYSPEAISHFKRWLELNGVDKGFKYEDMSPEGIWEEWQKEYKTKPLAPDTITGKVEGDITAAGEGVESVGGEYLGEYRAEPGFLNIQEGVGERVTRGAALSLQEKAIAAGMVEGFENLPEYDRVTAEDQIKRATEILKVDPKLAKAIAMGEKAAPQNTLPEFVLGVVVEKAKADGDAETILELATASRLLAEETTMGQRIWALSQMDKLSPVKAIQDVLKVQEKAYKGDLKRDKAKDKIKVIENIRKESENVPKTISEAIESGKINLEELVNKTPQERRDIFSLYVGKKDAHKVNADFEEKLLLKNQQKGIETWARQIKKEKVRKTILDKVQKMDKALNPKSLDKFLEDLVARKLGVGVTIEQAKEISKLAKTASDAKLVMENSPRRGHLEKPTSTEMNYGRASFAFIDYINALKEHAQKMTLAERLEPYNWWETIKMIAGVAKSAKSTFDNSGLLRQNLKGFWTNPVIWFRNANQSWLDIINVLNKKDVMAEIHADIISRPNYERYLKDKVAIGVTEEEFPYSDILEKLPVVGRMHLAAEVAFTGLARRNRVDFYDYFAKIAEDQGKEPTGLGIGRMVNSLTGRGHLGMWEGAADAINVMFFSMRFFKSNLDFLTAHAFDSKVDPWTKKQAAKNLLKTVIGTAAVLAMASAMLPGSVEEDRTSADYGRIKVGNTRFDITGGMGSLVTLASRLIPMAWGKGQMKSSTTGIITKLNAETFNAKTGLEVFYNFFENKLSPAAGFIRDLARGRNFQGEKPTPLSQLEDLFVPIIIQEFNELKSDPKSADILLALIAEGVGIGISTYSAEVDWDYQQGKILAQFKEEVGEVKYKEANAKFNKEWLEWFDEIIKHPKYQSMSEEDKQKTITKKKADIKDKLFRKYRFKYKQGE